MNALARLIAMKELPQEEFGQTIKNFRTLRVANKALENQGKTPLVSPDVVNADDFTYEPFVQERNGDGDSGNLLLATNKSNKAQKYIIKHAYHDCAANEYVFSKMAQAMGLKVPEIKLFRLSNPRDDTLFKTEYVVGTQYLNIIDLKPGLEVINKSKNAGDYYKFNTLHKIFCQNDILQVVLADDGYLYSIDNTDAFAIDDVNFMVAGAYAAEDKNDLYSKNFSRLWRIEDIDDTLRSYDENFGGDKRQTLMEPLFEIQKIRKPYIDKFLDTLCYFYPDCIGNYYGCFFIELKKTMKRFANMLVKYR